MITCLKCVITTTYAKCMTKSMKLKCVITVYTVFEQVWFSFLCTKYNFKINYKFCMLHNILSKDYFDEAGDKKAKKCFTFLFMWNMSWFFKSCILCQGKAWYLP